MSFVVNSVGTETPAIRRVIAILQRSHVAHLISDAGVFNCRKIAGSTTWSQHAYGNAVDLFPAGPSSRHAAERSTIFHSLIVQATRRTIANRGRKAPIAEIIDHNARLIWTPERGIHAYGGSYGDHVHVSGKPLRSGTPECAR